MDETAQFLKTLGKRIAVLRKQRGMSQEEFAEVSGKMINTISNIERGLSDPKITTLLALVHALGIDINSLFAQTVSQPLPEKGQEIVALIKNQDPHTLHVIEKQIKALLELRS